MNNRIFLLALVALVSTARSQTAPVITVAPQSAVVTAGQTASFSVTASGTNLAYQWRRNGLALPGATQATLTLGGVSRAEADTYDVVVSSGLQSTVSSGARLSVAPTSYPGLVAPDAGWNLELAGHGAAGYVTASLPDGRAYLGGAFVSVNGARRTGVVRVLADGSLDPAFTPVELESTVRALWAQPDGKVVVGGDFVRAGGLPRARLVRLNADGSLDASFGSAAGVNGIVSVVVGQPDGKLLIGGDFTSVYGTPRNRLARLNADGTVDAGFTANLNSGVATLMLQADGKIVAGGSFTTHTDALGVVTNRNGLSRLNADGSADLSFSPSLVGPVTALALQSDGQIVAGGQFGTFLFPEADEASNDVSGGIGMDRQNWSAGDTISCCQDSIGVNRSMQFELYVKSSVPFTTARTGASAALAAASASEIKAATGTNTNGIYWILVNGVPTQVYCLMDSTLDGGGWMLAMKGASGAGTFSYASEHWSTPTTLNPTLLRGNGPGVNEDAKFEVFNHSPAEKVMAIFPDVPLDRRGGAVTGQAYGLVWIEAMPTPANTANYVGRPTQGNYAGKTLRELFAAEEKIFLRDATVATPYRAAASGVFSSQAHVRFFGFNYRNANNSSRVRFGFGWNENGGAHSIARLRSDGSLDPSFTVGLNSAVSRLVVQGDGRILAGGWFTTVNGTNASRLVRLNADGTRDGTWVPQGFDGGVRWLEVQASGRILAAGDFSNHLDGANAAVARGRFARLNADGTLESGVNLTLLNHGEVNATLVAPGGKLLVAGFFTRARGVAVSNGLLRVNADGSVDSSFNPGGVGANGRVFTVVRQGDGKLLIGGSFTSYNGMSRDGLARLNADGTLDAGFNVAGTGGRDVYTVASLPGGGVAVGGSFTSFHGVSRNRIALLNADGTLNAGFNPGTGADSTVTTLVPLGDGRILAGGVFTSYNGASVGRIMRLGYDGALDTSFNPGGSGANSTVNVIQVSPEGKLYIGGWFGSYNGVGRGYVARLNADGTLDSTFGASPLNWAVYGMLLQEDGRLLVRGLFFSWANPLNGRLYRLNGDGSLDTSFEMVGLNQGSPFPNTLALTDGGQLAFGASNMPALVMTRAAGVPAITTSPVGQVAAVGGTASFSVVAGSVLPVSYQWYRDGLAVPGGTNATLTLTNVQAAQAGSYRVWVSNELGGAFSAAATLTGTGTAPVITVAPQSAVVTAGQTASFSVTASGTNLAYQWRRNGLALPGATQATLNLGPASRTLADIYDVVIASGLWTTVSAPVRLSVAASAAGQALTADPAFAPAFENAGGTVRAIVRLASGKIVVAGSFTSLGGIQARQVARLNADLSVDTAFNPPAINGTVIAVAAQADGKLVIAGAFSAINGSTRSGVARLNVDGSLDGTFVPVLTYGATGPGGSVNAVVVQTDGRIVVGTVQSGSAAGNPYLARLHTDGAHDWTFAPALNGSVSALALQPDGKLLAAGSFTTVSGNSINRIVRLRPTGEVDPDFIVGSGFNGTVSALARLPDGRVLVGGSFTAYQDQTANRLTLLAGNGSVDPTWQPGAGSNGTVNALVPAADGSWWVGGSFSTYDGASRANLVRVLSGGGLDVGFVPPAINGGLNALLALPDGGALLGGTFSSVAARDAFGLVRVAADAAAPATSFDPGLKSAGTVARAIPLAGGKILAAGTFTHVNGVRSPHLARLTSAGALDPSFNPGGTGPSAGVLDAVVQGDGKILIMGSFLQYNGVSRVRLARLTADGAVDPGFDPGAGPNTTGTRIYALSGGRSLLIGSNGLSSYGGAPRIAILRLNPDGALDLSFDAGAVNGSVSAVAVQPDGRMVIGGTFTSIAGVTRSRIARLEPSGAVDATFGPSADSSVSAVALQADGRILVGGLFGAISDLPRTRVARLLPSGSVDADWDDAIAPNSTVSEILPLEDGRIVLRGSFTTLNGRTLRSLARLTSRGSLDATLGLVNFGTATPSGVALLDDGAFLLSGGNLAVRDVDRLGLARTLSSPGPEITVTPSGNLGIAAGTALTLTAQVAGGGPVTYQWRRNGIAIPGANAASFTLFQAREAEGGAYTVEVTHAQGLAVSTAVNLNVAAVAPSLGTGQIASFASGFSSPAIRAGSVYPLIAPTPLAGSLPFSYQWFKDGVAVPGATGPAYNPSPWTLADSGSYSVRVSNAVGNATSPAVLQRVSGVVDWSPRFPLPQNNLLSNVHFLGGRFVAIGARGTILTSTDGVAWSVIRLGGSESSGVVAYGNGTYVALFTPGSVYTSPDALNWTRQNTVLGTDGRSPAAGPHSLTFAAGRFVAVGSRGLVATSNDGVAWSLVTSGTEEGLFSVAYGAGRFLATGTSGRTRISLDGVNWSPGPVFPEALTYAVVGGGLFVAGGGNYVYLSPDGTSWTRKSLPTTASIRGLQYTPQGFVALLSSTAPGEYVTSSDGTAWTKRQMNLNPFATLTSLAFGAGRFVVAGSAPEILSSADGVNWSRTGPPASFSFRAIAVREATAVAVGSSGTIYSSSDAFTWTPRSSGVTSQLNDVAASPAGFVAAGDAGVLLHSPDGDTWTAVASGTSASLRGISVVNGRFLAVGDGGAATTSADGQVWTPLSTGLAQRLNKVAFGAGTYVVVGNAGLHAASLDGVSWTPQASAGASALVDVVYERGLFVAVASDGRIRTSPDGFAWTDRANPVGLGMGALAWVNGRFYALSTGATSYLFSDDGIVWDVAQNGVGNVLNDVAGYAGYPLAVGNAGTIVAPAVPLITSSPGLREVAFGADFQLAPEIAGSGPFSYQWFRNGNVIPGATLAVLSRSAASATDAGSYSLMVTNANGSSVAPVASVAILSPVAPGISLQPDSQAVSEGSALTLTVGVSGTVPISYQWYRNGVLLPGRTTAALVVSPFGPGDVGSYQARVTNVAGLAESRAADITILPTGLEAAHVAVGGYFGGGTVTISSTLSFPGTASSLGWQVLVPAGWTYLSGAGAEGDIKPVLGTGGALEWAWTNPGASPVTFTYTMSVPAGQTGEQTLAALAIVRLAGTGALHQFLARPDPLRVAPTTHHSADTDRNFRISLLELTRVIELYNTRNGASRTGAYAVAAGTTEDGFEPAPSRALAAVVTLVRYHSADSNRNGRIDLLELTRVIELYNWRSNGSRTGQYKAKPGTEDGFDPGP